MTDHTNDLGQPISYPVEASFPRPRPGNDPIKGRFCSVVRLDPDAHAEGLFKANALDHEHRNWTYLPYGPFDDVAGYRDWMRSVADSADPMFHTVLDPDGAPIGVASYLRINEDAGSIEVGHINMSPRAQRKPAATEAMFLMMQRAFDTLGYRRYEWKCDALNAPSCNAAQRLGFSYEGTFRQATHYKGRNRDTAWYGIIDRDWPAIRAAFTAWLDPSNFDNDGQQIEPLAART